jgi:hypothetical protein
VRRRSSLKRSRTRKPNFIMKYNIQVSLLSVGEEGGGEKIVFGEVGGV